MKSLPFTIPNSGEHSFHVQEDNFEHFYPYLHRHPEIQITQIRKGKGFLLADNEVFPFQENDILIIASNVSHVFKDDSSTKFVSSVSLFFKHSNAENTLLAIPEFTELASYFGKIKPCQKIKMSLQSEFSILFEKINNEKRLLDKLLSFQKLLLLLHHQLELSTSEKLSYSEKDGDIMKQIIDFTLKNFDNDISIQDISAEIGYTPEAFCRFFKKRTAKTYISYINELRINKATQMLLNSNYSIGDIAFNSGFNNVTHFNRVFRKIKKTNPANFRKEIRSQIIVT